MNVNLGDISGKTAKDVSPTSPLVTLFIAALLTGKPIRGATAIVQHEVTAIGGSDVGGAYHI